MAAVFDIACLEQTQSNTRNTHTVQTLQTPLAPLRGLAHTSATQSHSLQTSLFVDEGEILILTHCIGSVLPHKTPGVIYFPSPCKKQSTSHVIVLYCSLIMLCDPALSSSPGAILQIKPHNSVQIKCYLERQKKCELRCYIFVVIGRRPNKDACGKLEFLLNNWDVSFKSRRGKAFSCVHPDAI